MSDTSKDMRNLSRDGCIDTIRELRDQLAEVTAERNDWVAWANKTIFGMEDPGPRFGAPLLRDTISKSVDGILDQRDKARRIAEGQTKCGCEENCIEDLPWPAGGDQ